MGKTIERILKLGKETLTYKDQITDVGRFDVTTLGEAIYETLHLTFKGFSGGSTRTDGRGSGVPCIRKSATSRNS